MYRNILLLPTDKLSMKPLNADVLESNEEEGNESSILNRYVYHQNSSPMPGLGIAMEDSGTASAEGSKCKNQT